MTTLDAHQTSEQIGRRSYGRLVGILAAFTGDIPAAEDALGDALIDALSGWPRDGIPDTPEAWLLSNAKRKLIDRARKARTAESAQPDVVMMALERASDRSRSGWPLPDPRLKLLFVCAHPAIAPEIHAPLMLQTVLGLSVSELAPLFLTPEATMSQQLVRAKRKIKTTKISFAIPDTDELPARIPAVLDAVYGAFAAGQNSRNTMLMDEATYLSSLCGELLPTEPSAKGLNALCLFQRARFGADRDAEGRFVPMDQQDPGRWNDEMIAKAEALLLEARRASRPDRYQLEAAIQSAHVYGHKTGAEVSGALMSLYQNLLLVAPSVGAQVGFAAATLAHGNPKTALSILDDMGPETSRYQPWWATRAAVAKALGDQPEVNAAYKKAIELSSDPAVRAHLAALAELHAD